MSAYYNENDPNAVAWLQELMKAGLIAPGEIDRRDIKDVRPQELRGFTQCHFFAGVGVWSYALRTAGWPDTRACWTGSPPCQPFSAAGRRAGKADKRHLWPHWFHLISQRHPAVVFAEQVASQDGLAWLDTVQADLEGKDYAVAPFDLCAAGFGAPHLRQRLYIVADSLRHTAGQYSRELPRHESEHEVGRKNCDNGTGRRRPVGELVHPTGQRSQGGSENGSAASVPGAAGIMANANVLPRDQGSTFNSGGHNGSDALGRPRPGSGSMPDQQQEPGPANGFWRAADWLFCTDGYWRAVEPGTFPLVDGAPSKMVRLRGYGNAIIPQVASEVIRAYMEFSR